LSKVSNGSLKVSFEQSTAKLRNKLLKYSKFLDALIHNTESKISKGREGQRRKDIATQRERERERERERLTLFCRLPLN